MNETIALKFEQKKQESLYDGFFQLNRYTFRHELFAGGWSECFQREIFERGHAAAVLLIDPEAQMLALIEQFRPGAVATEKSPWLLELVAGIIDEGEQPDQVAGREALEEAGAEIKKLRKICEYLVSPGGTTERIWLFLGEVDMRHVSDSGGLVDEHEDIRVHKVAIDQAFEWMDLGKVSNSMTLIALQWLKLQLLQQKPLWSEL